MTQGWRVLGVTLIFPLNSINRPATHALARHFKAGLNHTGQPKAWFGSQAVNWWVIKEKIKAEQRGAFLKAEFSRDFSLLPLSHTLMVCVFQVIQAPPARCPTPWLSTAAPWWLLTPLAPAPTGTPRPLLRAST